MALNNLLIDFNSYFASVEQQIKPQLRNKPIGVVPVLADTTCCIAASYEAKAFGVKTGTMVSDAKKLCPKIKFVEADHKKYIQYHEKLVKKIETCIHIDKVLSIDEVICSLMGEERKKENAIKIALNVKQKIQNDVGEYLHCSIGIGPNMFLAKMASKIQRPNGLVAVDNEDLPHCLYKFDLSEIYGIGRRMHVRLRRNGIYSVEDLCNANKTLLKNVWGGMEGERMFEQLKGKIVSRPPTHRSTVGHSHVLPPKLKNNESAYAVLHRLLQKAAMRLRHLNYYASALGVSVKYKIVHEPLPENKFYNNIFIDKDKYSYPHSKKVKWKNYITFNYTQNTIEFIEAFNILWKHNPFMESIPTAVGVVLFDLLHENYTTLPIFENFAKNKSFYDAIDKINKRYGYNSIYFAGAHTAKYSAPMRIAFTQIPNLEIEDEEKILLTKKK